MRRHGESPSLGRPPLRPVSFVLGVVLVVYGLAQVATGQVVGSAAPEILIGLIAMGLSILGTRYNTSERSNGGSLLDVSFIIGALWMLVCLVFAVGILIWGIAKGGSYVSAAVLAAIPALVVVVFGVRGLLGER